LAAISRLIVILEKAGLQMKRERMVIVTGYVEGESYGLLGPQLAASIIQDNTTYDCAVVAVTREDDKHILKKTLYDYFGNNRPVIGFSYLGGRTDLFSLARDFKEEGSFTILAGPQGTWTSWERRGGNIILTISRGFRLAFQWPCTDLPSKFFLF